MWVSMSNSWDFGIEIPVHIAAPTAGSHRIEEGIGVDEALTDKEMAMLEMIEFGIDRWSSSEGRKLAFALRARGLVRVLEEDGETSACLRCTITAEGSAALETARNDPFRALPHAIRQAG